MIFFETLRSVPNFQYSQEENRCVFAYCEVRCVALRKTKYKKWSFADLKLIFFAQKKENDLFWKNKLFMERIKFFDSIHQFESRSQIHVKDRFKMFVFE